MARQILIVIYILMVLALSGAVKADTPKQTSVTGHGFVKLIEVNEYSGTVSVHGLLATTCDSKPMIVVSKVDKLHDTIELDVMTVVLRAPCADVLGTSFDAAFDLRGLPLEYDKTYTVIFANYVGTEKDRVLYKAHPHLEGFVKQTVSKHALKGLLVYFANPMHDGDAGGYALKNGAQLLPISSNTVGLENFQNRFVNISGYIVDNSVVPAAISAH